MQTSQYKLNDLKGGKRKIREILLASHVYLAKGMLSSLELIMGKQENIDILCAYTDDQYDIKAEIYKKLELLAPEDELIVISDLFGGSVNNEFTTTLTGTDKKIYLIAGMNLALLMNLTVRKDEDIDTEQLIKECVEESKSTIIYCNDLLKQNEDIEEDEF